MKQYEKYLVIGTRRNTKDFYNRIVTNGALEGQIGAFDTGNKDGLKNLIIKTYYDIKDQLLVIANPSTDDISVSMISNENSCSTTDGSKLEISCDSIAVDREVNIIAQVTLNESVCLTPQQAWKNLGGHQIIPPLGNFLADIFGHFLPPRGQL